MLGAIAVAALSAVLTLHEARWYLGPIYRLATCIHSLLFGTLIARGWVCA
jgi:undecaprenyl-diphosphatase